MTEDWQSIAAIAIVLAAVLYIARRVYRIVVERRQPGCGSGCSTCPAGQKADEAPVVGLDALNESARRVANRS